VRPKFVFTQGAFFRCKPRCAGCDAMFWRYFEIESVHERGATVIDVRTGQRTVLTGPFEYRGQKPYYEQEGAMDPFLHSLESVSAQEAMLHVEQAKLDHERKEVEAMEERNRHLDYCRQIETSAMEHLTVAEPMRIAAE
jgi:hypothetical protein